ncbi:MAG: serine hydrolase, partial [Calditrichia bacterium]|nr:serine hydrolase [Calditrichia bacterium]
NTITWNEKKNDKVQEILKKYSAQNAFTGAAAFTFRNDKINYQVNGKAKNVRRKLVDITADSLFDLASLTKIFSTTLLILHLVTEKKISLSNNLGFYFLDCPEEKRNITIQQLLNHTSGLKSWMPLYKKYEKHENYKDAANEEQAIRTILESLLENIPGEKVVYSDLGFILLARIIEYILDKPIHYAFRDILAIPLNIENDLFYLTPKKLSDTRLIAANSNWKTDFDYLQFINDQNARLFITGTGHAGLFGNLKGIGAINQLILNNGIWKDRIIIDQEIMQNSFEIFTAKDGSQRALGWDITWENTQSGKYFANPDSRGHLSFTGCAFWFDTIKKTSALLLANRSFTEYPVEEYKNIRRDIFEELGTTFK